MTITPQTGSASTKLQYLRHVEASPNSNIDYCTQAPTQDSEIVLEKSKTTCVMEMSVTTKRRRVPRETYYRPERRHQLWPTALVSLLPLNATNSIPIPYWRRYRSLTIYANNRYITRPTDLQIQNLSIIEVAMIRWHSPLLLRHPLPSIIMRLQSYYY